MADDIIALLICIKNDTVLSRSLLKNGKRSREYLNAFRTAEVHSALESPMST